MKKVLFIIMCLFCISVKAETIEVEYKKCVDGDTAWFIMNEEEIKVRFIAINAPELEKEEKEAERKEKIKSN